MVSLGGVYAPSTHKPGIKIPAALDNYLQNNTGITTVALHLDNDNVGRGAALSIAEQLNDRYLVRNEPPPLTKDCNDYLMHIRRRQQEHRYNKQHQRQYCAQR